MSIKDCSWARVLALCTLAFLGSFAAADSFTGTFSSDPTQTFQHAFTLGSASNVTVQTWGFGGGTNAHGDTILAGGFDPLVALFSGSGNSATIVLDGSGNEAAGADNLVGGVLGVANCPPAGTVAIGGANVCGDIKMTVNLAAGVYTLLLSDANYIPYAVNPGPPGASTIGDGFADLTGGVFQTCIDATHCITPNGEWAVDLLTTAANPVPEPGTLVLIGTGAVAHLSRRKFAGR